MAEGAITASHIDKIRKMKNTLRRMKKHGEKCARNLAETSD